MLKEKREYEKEMAKKEVKDEKRNNLGGEKEKMKTKNKRIALVEIVIVLCSLFLVALPVIAAEQIQEMQKISASTITTASED
ncbi:MAG: hypothetical protein KAT65_21370, partial [Methanophagales archaeon]|nr:hypothetical protein [Methanophagales archaeon]